MATRDRAVPDESKAGRREWAGLAVLTLACLIYAMDLIPTPGKD
jgi:hypothetical protein